MEKNSLTWDDVKGRLGFLGLSVAGTDSTNGDVRLIPFNFKNVNFGDRMLLSCDREDPSSVGDALVSLYQNFDVDVETFSMLDSDGHGPDGEGIEEVLDNVKDAKNCLRVASEKFSEFLAGYERVYTKEEIGELFMSNIERRMEGDNLVDVMTHAGHATNDIVVYGCDGLPRQKKAALNEYLASIGCDGKNMESVLNEELFKRELVRIAKTKPINTTSPDMSTTDFNVHRMFDRLFNESDTTPKKFAQTVLDASEGATVNGLRGERWWERAVYDACNSGGDLWQDTFARMTMLEDNGLLVNDIRNPELERKAYDSYRKYMGEYGLPSDIVDMKGFMQDIFYNQLDMREYLVRDEELSKKYFDYMKVRDDMYREEKWDKIDKIYSKHMHKYLKDLGVLDDRERDRTIQRRVRWHNEVDGKKRKEPDGMGR